MWTGDTPIFPIGSSTTSALIPAMNVSITATYTGTGGGGSGGTGTGLLGQYYNDPSNSSYPLANPFTGTPVLTRTDANVDFAWGGNSPSKRSDLGQFLRQMDRQSRSARDRQLHIHGAR